MHGKFSISLNNGVEIEVEKSGVIWSQNFMDLGMSGKFKYQEYSNNFKQ
jgi:hypothetical protein